VSGMAATPAALRAPQLLVIAGALALGLPWMTWETDISQAMLVAFALAAVAGELLDLEPPRGRPVPTSVAVLAAFALLGPPPWLVAVVGAVGWAGAAVVRGLTGEVSHGLDLVNRLIVGWALAGLAAFGATLPGAWAIGTDGDVTLHAVVAVTAGLVFGIGIWEAASDHEPEAGFLRRAGHHVYVTWVSNLALASSAALVAVAYDLLNFGALFLLFLPVIAVRAGLHRYTDIRRTYDQTVIAMTRMTELTGHVASGHGVRVGELAVSVARQMRMSERDVRQVERAAHLHEVGRIATDDPEQRAHDREVALAGATIVREAGDMEWVAEVIERHRDPYRRPGDTRGDESLPIGARIVRTVCEFDRQTHGDRELPAWEAVDVLHRSMAYDHDPAVVQALSAVVASRRN
jgi:hypothetical protein